MISKQEASELIFAGVLGCLDWTDQTRWQEYIKSGGELPSTVGEFQNIAALLPLILEPETPSAQLKDKVARKLYRIRDEVRSKLKTDNKSAAEVFYEHSRGDKKLQTPGEESLNSEPENIRIEEEKSEIEIPEDSKSPTEEAEIEKEVVIEEEQEEVKPGDFEPVNPSRSTFESFKSTREKVLEGNFDEPSEEKKPVPEEEIKSKPEVPTGEKIQTYERVITKEKTPHKTPAKESPLYRKPSTKDRGKNLERAYKKKFSTGDIHTGKKPVLNLWVIISLFIILVLAIAVISLYFISEIKDLKFTNNSLKQQVTELSVKFNNSQDIQKLMESPDVRIINLEGTDINPMGKGKLIISRSRNKGYLQLSDMPVLGQDRAYQLWMQLSAEGYFSLGIFRPAGKVQYFPFKLPQAEAGTFTGYIVTEESSLGASKPGNNVFLKGSFQ
jgi:anti-sigma-K factor RskA